MIGSRNAALFYVRGRNNTGDEMLIEDYESEVISTDEQAEDSNDSIGFGDPRLSEPDPDDLFNPSPSDNVVELYTLIEEDLKGYINDDSTREADLAIPEALNLSPAPVDMPPFIPLYPTYFASQGLTLPAPSSAPPLDLFSPSFPDLSPVVTPTGPLLQQFRPGGKLDAIVISEERVTLCYWPDQNKLFVAPYTAFSMQFRFTPPEGSAGISHWKVRCTAVFTKLGIKHSAVRRCKQRKHNHLPAEGALGIVEVVDEDEAEYHGFGTRNSHYSVVVPLQAPSYTVQYQTTCTRRCPHPGVNFRDLALEFTVEDHSGTVYGRDHILVRSCAKPERDLAKDQEKQNMEPACSAQSEEQPGRRRAQKKRRVLTPRCKVTKKASVAHRNPYKNCILSLIQAASYDIDKEDEQNINKVIRNLERKMKRN